MRVYTVKKKRTVCGYHYVKLSVKLSLMGLRVVDFVTQTLSLQPHAFQGNVDHVLAAQGMEKLRGPGAALAARRGSGTLLCWSA